MKVAACSILCDAIEIAALQLGKSLTPQDILKEISTASPDQETQDLIAEAFGLAVQRATMCPTGYPFDVSARTIQAKVPSGFSTYLFLLLGSSLRNGGVVDPETMIQRFRKYFEDLVCYCLRCPNFSAEILSIPREERGLDKSLKPALRTISKRWGECAELLEDKITSDDNDLGVDVLATTIFPDSGRSGKPIFLVQCATGDLNGLESKMMGKLHVFSGVWKTGFFRASSIRCGATPEDLITLQPVFWNRLCDQGWVIDRMRLVRMAHSDPARLHGCTGLTQLWEDMFKVIPIFDWRTGWEQT